MIRKVSVAFGLDNKTITASRWTSRRARLCLRAFRIVVAVLVSLCFLYFLATVYAFFGPALIAELYELYKMVSPW